MRAFASVLLLALVGCELPRGTRPPPDGWANNAPTVIEQVVTRPETQLLAVKQGELRTWVEVPAVGATVGEYVLLGKGTAREDVPIPELGVTAPVVVDIAHVLVVDAETAERTLAADRPRDAVPIGTVYQELDQRADQPIVVYGTVVRAPSAVGSVWVHLQDGSGDPSANTHDLTVQTDRPVTRGQRVAFTGTLRKNVDLGFGYHYDALVEGGQLLE